MRTRLAFSASAGPYTLSMTGPPSPTTGALRCQPSSGLPSGPVAAISPSAVGPARVCPPIAGASHKERDSPRTPVAPDEPIAAGAAVASAVADAPVAAPCPLATPCATGVGGSASGASCACQYQPE